MGDTILLRRGTAANLPDLQEGEPGFATDTKVLYIGAGAGTAESAAFCTSTDIDAIQYEPNTFTQATIAAALTAIGTTNKVTLLLRPGDWVISSNADWSAYTNVTFKIVPGAVLSGAFTVNIPNIDAGKYKIFDSTLGVVTLSGSFTEIYPQWWGASPDAAAATNNTAFTKSIAALNSYQTWRLPSGNYSTSQVTTFANKSRVKIIFDGMISTSTHNGILFDTVSLSEILDIDILYPSSDWAVTYYGVKFLNCGNNNIRINSISRFYKGVYFQTNAAAGHYNTVYFNQIYDAFYAFYIENTNAGATSENSVSGGKHSVTAAHTAAYTGVDGAWTVYFAKTDTYAYTNWKFYDVNSEGISNGYKLTSTSNIMIMHPRWEATAANAGEYYIDTYYYVGPTLTAGATSNLILIPGITSSGLDMSKFRLGLTRDLLILGGGNSSGTHGTIVTDNDNGGITWVTERNINVSHADLTASHTVGMSYRDHFGITQYLNKGYHNTAIPTTGTFRENAIVWNTSTGAGGSLGWQCTADGTMGADPAGMTVTTTAASDIVTITAGDVNDLLPGQYILVAGETFGGVAAGQISWVDYDNDTFVVTAVAGAGVVSAALTYNDATWTNLPAAAGWVALPDSATPSVLNLEKVVSGGTTTITNFTNGVSGQELKFYAAHSITITDGTNIFLSGSANYAMDATDTLWLIQRSDGKWYEFGRSNN